MAQSQMSSLSIDIELSFESIEHPRSCQGGSSHPRE